MRGVWAFWIFNFEAHCSMHMHTRARTLLAPADNTTGEIARTLVRSIYHGDRTLKDFPGFKKEENHCFSPLTSDY